MATKSSRVSRRFLKQAETLKNRTFTSSSCALRYPDENEVAPKLDLNYDSDASLVDSRIGENILLGWVVLASMM